MLLAAVLAFASCSGEARSPQAVVPEATSALPTVTALHTPTPAPTPDPLAGRSVEWKVGQMLMAGIDGYSAGWDAQRLIGDLQVGNVVLLGRNLQSPEQIFALTLDLQRLAAESNEVPALIGTDQEGGTVERLEHGFTALPDAALVGAAGNPELARRLGRVVGDELRAVGINVEFAPVLDVTDNPNNWAIGPRAFGSTAEAVELTAVPFALGVEEAGVASVGKHFPGHGSTDGDSHHELPLVTKTRAELDETELRPYREAIAAGLPAVMTAHVGYSALDPSGAPATLSPAIIDGLLRRDLGFKGIVISDDFAMPGLLAGAPTEQAVVLAVQAGVDVLLCACPLPYIERMRNALLRAVEEGTVPLARIDESVRRVLALKDRYASTQPTAEALATVGSESHRAVVLEILDLAARR